MLLETGASRFEYLLAPDLSPLVGYSGHTATVSEKTNIHS
jgi:hypothetical protein